MCESKSVIFLVLSLLIVMFKKCESGNQHPPSSVREVSHEDIRDAILSLVNIFRDNTDKLERHEARERQLGELLKKSFASVEKKQKIEETNVAAILDTLNNINKRLETIENVVHKDANKSNKEQLNNIEKMVEPKLKNLEHIINNNEVSHYGVTRNIDQKLDSIISNVQQIQMTTAALQHNISKSSPTENLQATDIISKFDTKLEEIQPQLEKHHQTLDRFLALQQTTIQQSEAILEILQYSVKLEDLKESMNSTFQHLNELKYDIESGSEKDVVKLKETIGKSQEILQQEQQNILSAISDSVVTNEGLNANMVKTYDQLFTEIKGLSKIEQVLIQTADNVLDAKRRVEYGTHQILLEVGDLIKLSAKDTNDTINKRFDMISSEILNNQNGALTNLSAKIETEISQVWRQIGIMYQTLTNSADALNKLQQQTEIYVNGSLSTMDNMEGKVGQITSRMNEVDENLNYLLGRLSLVTQEFNQIKTGLGDALDNIRSSFHTVQDKMKDVGPGPNPIEDDDSVSDGKLQKTQYTVS